MFYYNTFFYSSRHCLSTISSTGYGNGQIVGPNFGNLGPNIGNIDNNLLPLGNLHIPSETSYSASGDKIISTEGCYSCKLNSNNRQKRDVLNTTRLNTFTRRQQRANKIAHHPIRRTEKKLSHRLVGYTF